MKIDKVYINKEGAPMVSRNGWPDLDITDVGINAIRAAKRDAVPLDTSHEQTARSLVLPITICDSFIDVEIEVEFVDQYKNYDWKMWEDCDDRGTKPWHLLRTIARVVPEKAEEPLPDITLSGVNTRQSLFNYMHEQHGVTLLESDVDEIQNILVDVTLTAQQINDECQKHNDELVKQLAAAQERVKVLETENKHMKSLLAKYAENE